MSSTFLPVGTETRIRLGSVEFIADVSGALFEPQTRSVIVADCHFEKGSSLAARGHFLPPFDTRDNLLRLQDLLDRFKPQQLISLGDAFHDRAAVSRLAPEDRAIIEKMGEQCALIWVAGNHDPEPHAALPGQSVASFRLGDVMLQHEPSGDHEFEIAGHLHPAAKVRGRGRALRRRCFISNEKRCIMPALGAYAGGLNILDEAFKPFFGRGGFHVHALGRDRLYAIAPHLLLND